MSLSWPSIVVPSSILIVSTRLPEGKSLPVRAPVRAEKRIHGSDQQSCSADAPPVMITDHVPAVRVPADHATSRVAGPFMWPPWGRPLARYRRLLASEYLLSGPGPPERAFGINPTPSRSPRTGRPPTPPTACQAP